MSKDLTNRIIRLEQTFNEMQKRRQEQISFKYARVQNYAMIELLEEYMRTNDELETLSVGMDTYFILLFSQFENFHDYFDMFVTLDQYFVLYGGVQLKRGEPYFNGVATGGIPLLNVLLVEALSPYFHGSLADEEMGITHINDDFKSIIGDISAILSVLIDTFTKFAEYQTKYESVPDKHTCSTPPHYPNKDAYERLLKKIAASASTQKTDGANTGIPTAGII